MEAKGQVGFDPEQAKKDLDRMIGAETKDSAKIAEFLSQEPSIRTKTVKWGEMTIKIRGYLTRKVRFDIASLDKEMNRMDVESLSMIEGKIYNVLAELCLEDPFNNPDTWRDIDIRTGCVFDFMNEVISKAYAPKEGIDSFRKK